MLPNASSTVDRCHTVRCWSLSIDPPESPQANENDLPDQARPAPTQAPRQDGAKPSSIAQLDAASRPKGLLPRFGIEIVVALILLVLLFGVGYWDFVILAFNSGASGSATDGIAVERHDNRDHPITIFMCITEGSNTIDTSVLVDDYPSTFLNLALPSSAHPGIQLGYLQQYLDTGSICGDSTYSNSQLALLPPDPLRLFPPNTDFGPPQYPIDCVTYDSAKSSGMPAPVVDSVKRGFRCVLFPVKTQGPVPVHFQWTGGVQHLSYTDRSVVLVIPPLTTTAASSDAVATGESRQQYPISVVIFLPKDADVYYNASGAPVEATIINNRTVRRISTTIAAERYAQVIEVDWHDESLSSSRDLQLLVSGTATGVLASLLLGLFFAKPRWSK